MSVVFYDNATNAILDITVNYVDDNNVTINSAVAVHGLVVCIGGPTGAAAVPGEDTFGFVKRYALLLIIPSNIKKLEIDIDDISEDIVEKLSQGAYINQCLKAWGTLINDIHGPVSFERGNLDSEEIPDQIFY